MKSFFLCLSLCFLSFINVNSQTNSRLHDTFNKYLFFSDKVSTQSKSLINCLSSYQRRVYRFKRYKSKPTRLYFPNCTRYQITYQYRDAQKGDIASLNSQTTTLKNIFDQIKQQISTLKAYATKKTYLTDNYAFSYKTIDRIQKLFDRLQTTNERFKQNIYNEALRRGNPQNHKYRNVTRKMRQILAQEDKFQKDYLVNLNNGSYVTPTEQMLASNVQRLSDLVSTLPALERAPGDFSIANYYSTFKSYAKRLLSKRRKLWDKVMGKANIYSSRSNYEYDNLVKQFNNFTRSCKAKKIYLLPHSHVSSRFVLKKVSYKRYISKKVVIKTFTDVPVPPLKVSRQPRPIDQSTLKALNSYIHCMNEVIQRNNSLVRSIVRHNNHIKRIELAKKDSSTLIVRGRKRKLYYPFYFNRNYYYPKSLFFMAEQKSKILPVAYRTSLNAQLDNIKNLLEEVTSLGHQLNAYLKKRGYKQDQFARSKKILARYQYLYKMFDAKRNRLYADLLKIEQSYPKGGTQAPVSNADATLNKALDLGLPIMNAAHKFMKKESKDLLDKRTSAPLVQAFGKDFKTPYSRQRRGEWRVARRIKSFVKSVNSITNALGKYRVSSYTIKNLIYSYNRIIEHHNDKAVQDKRLLKMRYPDILSFERTGYTPCDCGSASDDVDMTSMEGYAHNNLMLLLDVSGSMKDELPMLKNAMKYLVKIMRPQDYVSVIVFESQARVMLRPTSAKYQGRILQAIDTLKSKGSTNGQAGITKAYDVLQQHYIKGGNNRIILVTDGEFMIRPSIYSMISEKAQQDVTMSVFSFADQITSYNKLQRVAKQGKGNYEVLSPGNAIYKMVREAQSKKLPGKRRKRNRKQTKFTPKPCDCNNPPINKITTTKITTTTQDSSGVNMTSMKGFAPNNLMLLLDVSGSMASKNKLPLLKTAFKNLVDIMRPEDEVSVVVYAGDASVVLKPTSANQSDMIKEVINKLRAKGQTDVKKGFKLAYKWMSKNYKEGGNNRIILATDGEFPISNYVYKLVRKRAEKGVYLSVFSFGSKKKFDSLQKLVEKGQGNYEHVDESNVQYKLVKEAQSIKKK